MGIELDFAEVLKAEVLQLTQRVIRRQGSRRDRLQEFGEATVIHQRGPRR
ncbi:MAG: hypothetical protein ABI743_13030 [bacterium]